MRRIMILFGLMSVLGVSGQAQSSAPFITAQQVIAYVAKVDDTARAFVTDADGLTPQEIAPSAAFVRWSWDGEYLLVAPPQAKTIEIIATEAGLSQILGIPGEPPEDAVLLNALPTWYREAWVMQVADAAYNTLYINTVNEEFGYDQTQIAQFSSTTMSVQIGDVGFHREASDMLALLKLTGQGVGVEILSLPTGTLRPIEGLPPRRMMSVLGFAPDGVHLALAEHDMTQAETRLYYVTVPPEEGRIEAKAPAAMLTNTVQILDTAYMPETSTLLLSVASAPPSTSVALIEWDTTTNSLTLVALEHPTNGIFDVSPDGKFMALAGTGGELWRLERSTGKMTLLAQTQAIYAIDWQPDILN